MGNDEPMAAQYVAVNTLNHKAHKISREAYAAAFFEYSWNQYTECGQRVHPYRFWGWGHSTTVGEIEGTMARSLEVVAWNRKHTPHQVYTDEVSFTSMCKLCWPDANKEQ